MILHNKISIVIPCYKARSYVIDVINKVDSFVDNIYVIDDCCPEKTGDLVRTNCKDKRVKVIQHSFNQGVGAAVMSGYKEAIKDGMDIIVKIDGDGQMDPALIINFIMPIINDNADYCKGNRFYDLEKISQMPGIRILGNSLLSLLNKFSSGYWDIFDPTNGYTAIHSNVLIKIPFQKISSRFFFETDMLFRLSTLRAVVLDIPMDAKYENENSNLKISKIFLEFLGKHLRNMFKRFFYNYYLRGMTAASFELPLGIALSMFGFFYGVISWANGIHTGSANSVGTVILSALPLLIGIQFILAFVSYDVFSVPRVPIHKMLNILSKNSEQN
jgi:dolichol-phosphate mannosyltransferase